MNRLTTLMAMVMVTSTAQAQTDTPLADAGVFTLEPSIPVATPAPSPAPVITVTEPEIRPEVRETVVTGSRIPRKDLTSAAPVSVYTREQIQATGRTNVGEFLQTLPEVANSINRNTNNGGDGAIRANLRGLGPQSTLVLLNGRRLVPGGTGADLAVDLSALPTNVIERIEVLKDGASAIYGSDAIAGVINVITRKKVSGGEAFVYGSTTTAGDGQQVDVSGIVGVTGERGSALVSANFYTGAPVWAGNRDYSRYQRILDGTTFSEIRLGSGTIPSGRVVLSPSEAGVANGNDTWNALVRANPTATSFIRNDDGTYRPFAGAALPLDQGDGWNYQPSNYLVTPQQRFNVFSSGEYRLGQYVRAFYDALYSKRTSDQVLAPEPLLTDGEGVLVSAQNVYNPFGRDFDAVRRRLVEFGRRRFNQDVNNFHLAAGLDGDLEGPLQGFHWEAVFNFSRNDATVTKNGGVRLTRLQNAVGPSFIAADGTPTCGTPGAPIAGCVPLNLFGGPGSITQAQRDYLTFTGISRGYNQLIGGQLNLTGELFRLGAERKIAIAVGYDGRYLSGGNFPDPITVAGETSGNKGLITEGGYSVHEGFAEVTVPIVDRLPGLDLLEVTGAFRGSGYSNFGPTLNYKVGGRYRPIRDVTVRGSVGSSFRAPSIPELFGGQEDNFGNVSDPCAKVEPGSVLERNCGAAANNGDDQTQLRSRVGGNTALQPETATTFTIGSVVEPRFVKGLALTFDYWNTTVSSTVSGIGESIILQGCYPSVDGTAPNYCKLITRDPTTQRILAISNLNQNAGKDAVDGFDMAATYSLATPIGRWSAALTATWLLNYDRTLADGTVVRGAGTFDLNNSGASGSFPRLRAMASLSWRHGGFSAGLRTYVIGSFRECSDASGEFSGSGLCYASDDAIHRAIPAWNNWDLNFGYQFSSPVGRTSLTAGVTNLFNQTPPTIYNGFSSNTDTYNYDLALRQVFLRVAQNF